jgi:Na+-transporting methylmalonyl-CoA/oxaloacetate decarboxylase gamma subunit
MLRMNVLSVCIGILLIGWGVTMNMVVGYELSNYRSFMESILTLVKVVFGDADFGELMELDNRMFALITFGMYCVMIFFIILSMFFAMVSAAQEAIEEANDDDDESVPRVLKDLAHFFRPIFKALGYVPIVGALVPDQRSLLLIINAESEDEEDGATAADEEEEEEVPNDPFDTLKSDSEDFLRTVSDPSVVVLEALQDIGASQKELQDLLRVSTARKRAVADRERIKSMESREGSMGSRPPSQGGSLPPSRGASRGPRGSVDFGAGLDAARRSRGSLDGPPPG